MNVARALAVVTPLVFGASLALAGEAPQAEKKPAAQAPGGKGLVVFIDPATGKIRQPDAAEIGGLIPPPGTPGAFATLAEKPLETRFGPGGAVGVVLDERFESFMVVTKAKDGKLTMGCVEGRKKADAAVAAQGTADAR